MRTFLQHPVCSPRVVSTLITKISQQRLSVPCKGNTIVIHQGSEWDVRRVWLQSGEDEIPSQVSSIKETGRTGRRTKR